MYLALHEALMCFTSANVLLSGVGDLNKPWKQVFVAAVMFVCLSALAAAVFV